MEENRLVLVGPDVYTVGPCYDPHWPRCHFASCGPGENHVTFIVHLPTGRIQAIHTRGTERTLWGLWLIAFSTI